MYSKILISHHAIFSQSGQGGSSIWRVDYNTLRNILFLEPIVEILKSQLHIGERFPHEGWPLDIPGVVEHRKLIEVESDIRFGVILSLNVLFFNSIEVILKMPEDVDSWRSKFLTALTEVLVDDWLVFDVHGFHEGVILIWMKVLFLWWILNGLWDRFLKGEVGDEGFISFCLDFAIFIISFSCEFDVMLISGVEIKSWKS